MGVLLWGLFLVSSGYAASAEMEGVYNRPFRIKIHTSTGDRPMDVVDKLEFVKQSDDALYFHIQLYFAGGDSCGIYGIAHKEDGTFVYRDRNQVAPCTLTIQTQGKNLVVSDSQSKPTCSAYCRGVGSLSDYKIALSAKQPLKDKERLLASPEFKEASKVDQRKKP